jgi:hypothetical protein
MQSCVAVKEYDKQYINDQNDMKLHFKSIEKLRQVQMEGKLVVDVVVIN